MLKRSELAIVGPRAITDEAHVLARRDVQAEDRLRHRVLAARPRWIIIFAPPSSPCGRHLFGGLEDELHAAAQMLAQAGEHRRPRPAGSRCGSRGRRRASRRPPRRSRSRAPSTRTARRRLRSPAARPCRRAAPPRGPGSPPFSRPTTPVCATPVRTSSRPRLLQVLGDDAAVRDFAVAEFGVLVKVAPPGDHARLDGCGRGVDAVGEAAGVWCGNRRCAHEKGHYHSRSDASRPWRRRGFAGRQRPFAPVAFTGSVGAVNTALRKSSGRAVMWVSRVALRDRSRCSVQPLRCASPTVIRCSSLRWPW